MLPWHLLVVLAVATMAALVGLAALPAVLGWIVVPRVMRRNRARLRRNLAPLGFVDHDDVLAGTVDGVAMKARHHLDEKGEVIDVIAWGLPTELELEAQTVGPRESLRFAPRFVGPARGRAWLTSGVEDEMDELARHGKLEVFDGCLLLSAPMCTRCRGEEVVLAVARFVRRVLDQDVVTVDDALPSWSPHEQLRTLRYAARRDALRDTGEAVELARGLLDSGHDLDPSVWERCVFTARDELGLHRLLSDPTRPMSLRLRALDSIPDPFLAVAVAGVVPFREPALWERALRRASESTDPAVVWAMAELLASAVLPDYLAADPGLVQALAGFLRAHADTEEISMDRLRPLLDVEWDAIRLAALRIVGNVGTVHDVADLRRRQRGAIGTHRYALRRAVARIQQRAAGEAGGLALAELVSGGELALAPVRGGVALAVES